MSLNVDIFPAGHHQGAGRAVTGLLRSDPKIHG